jgi:hypothetical protein
MIERSIAINVETRRVVRAFESNDKRRTGGGGSLNGKKITLV